jgi:hypothetical protein
VTKRRERRPIPQTTPAGLFPGSAVHIHRIRSELEAFRSLILNAAESGTLSGSVRPAEEAPERALKLTGARHACPPGTFQKVTSAQDLLR